MKKETFYVTTPIYYATGNPHLGHAYTSIAADILARWKRIENYDVFFMTGTDEHGQKVQKKAEEKNIIPQKLVDSLVPQFEKQLKSLNISYDYFIRTTDEHHKKFVQNMLQKAYDNGDIYKDVYEGQYCVDCEQYYKEDELVEGKICPIHKSEVNVMKEENYFFKLSKYEGKLLELYEKNTDFLSPSSMAQETINRVREGLQDISISRNKETLSWGIELPFDSEHVAYVWFDALFNYLSGLEINDKENYWPADVQIVGKDIMWFHKVYWPAFLMSCGYDIPKKVFAHGWWTVNGDKMGKSLGNVVDPEEVALKYGRDELRYFLFAIGTFGENQDFSYEKFAEKINNELNNDLGNLVSRVHSMTNKYFKGVVPSANSLDKFDENLLDKFSNLHLEFKGYMDSLQFNKAIESLWFVIRETNAYINTVEPWKVENEERLATIMSLLVSSMRLFSTYISPFMPEKAERLNSQFNFSNDFVLEFSFVDSGHKLNRKDNLFAKINLEEEVEEESKFSKLNLVVGKILEVENHPEADKLYVETIDIGETENRTIVSGLKDHYLKEDLVGKKVIVVANLKPAKLRGVKSEGMVLLAEDELGNLGFLESNDEVGSNVFCNDLIANNSKRIKIDDFFEVPLIAKNGKVYYEEKVLSTQSDDLSVEKKIEGNVR